MVQHKQLSKTTAFCLLIHLSAHAVTHSGQTTLRAIPSGVDPLLTDFPALVTFSVCVPVDFFTKLFQCKNESVTPCF